VSSLRWSSREALGLVSEVRSLGSSGADDGAPETARMCRFSDAGRHERFHRHRGRRPKTSKGRNRGKGHALGGAAGSAMGIWRWTGNG